MTKLLCRWHAVCLFLVLGSAVLILSRCTSPTADAHHAPTLNLDEVTIDALQTGYRKGNYTITDVVRYYLNRIDSLDDQGPALHAILWVNPDALAIAEALDEERKAGTLRGPLHGIPVILKDNINAADSMPTTAGARVLAHTYPMTDGALVKQLRDAGAIILAKANLSEWANFHSSFSSSGWSGVGGQTKNPYDLSRNPCGSSSGSGVAVSANFCVVAIGTETNGSIVCPSNNNGIVGIKPTVGLISRAGIIPISHTMDTPGPMARTVRDAARCLGAMTAADTADEKTLTPGRHALTDYTPYLQADALKGKRLGWYTQSRGRHHHVDTLMQAAVDFMIAQGADVIELEEVEEPTGRAAFDVMLYEFKAGLNAYFQTLGPNAPVKNLADLIAQTQNDSLEMLYFDHSLLTQAEAKGDLSDPAYQEALTKLLTGARAHGIDRVLAEHHLDALIAPTGGPAWETDLINGDRFMVGSSSPAAHAGYPNITVPMGYIDGLPVGISFFSKAWSEPLLISLAYAYEQGTHWRSAPMIGKD